MYIDRSRLRPASASARTQSSSAIWYATAACCVLFLAAAGINFYGAIDMRTFSGSTFHFLIGALSLYLLVECLMYLRRCDAFGLLAPPFLASLFHFYLAYILPSTGALFDPWILDRFAKYFSTAAEQMSQVVSIIALAAFCMWRGYGLGCWSARNLRRALTRVGLLRQRLEPALLPVLGLQFAYLALVSYAISQGIFGMAGSAEMREHNVALLEVINIGLAGGSLSLFLLLTYLFRRGSKGYSNPVLAITIAIFVCLHLVTGALSGFKSQVVMPFVLVAIARFVATRQISIAYIAAACVAVIVAYQVIEPFRYYLARNSLQGQGDIGSLIGTLQESYEQKNLMLKQDIPLASQILSRSDLTGMSAVGIAFSTGNPSIDLKREEFFESLYLSPILAYVPRALWPGKPIYTSGIWFNNVVLGDIENTTTSVGMGPVTWLYIMGGTLGVTLGFLGLGFVQALLFEGVGRSGAGGFIIFLSTFSVLTQIPTDFGPALTGMLRILPIAAAAQFILLKPDNFVKLSTR